MRLTIFVFLAWATTSSAAEPILWPQFHGPGGNGVAAASSKVPREFGPSTNVLWKTPLPRGHSSPCIWGNRIYVTGCEADSKNLETICLDRVTGKVLWRAGVPLEHQEPIHELNSAASSTPATDGEFVFAYFGQFGLVCYDRDGKEIWKKSVRPIAGRFGSAQSPVVAGEFVVIHGGSTSFSFSTTAFDRKTGNKVWEKFRPRGFAQGLYATPLVRPCDRGHEVIVTGGQRVCGLNLADGSERWFMTGLPNSSLNSAVVGDGMAIFTLSNPIGDGENVVQLLDFGAALKEYDKNGDKKIQIAEIPAVLMMFTRHRDDKVGDWSPVRQRARNFDEDRDGALSSEEWATLQTAQAKMAESAAIATLCVRLDGKGDVSESHVLWKQTKSAPEVPSPLMYQGLVYLVSEKGIVTCRDAKTGQEHFRERLHARGICYSSPVAGDGVVLTASDGGTVLVLKAGDKFELLNKVQFSESILATPALVDNKIYLRTDRHLFAIGEK